MSGLKESEIAFQAAKNQITPDEQDSYVIYNVTFPSLSATYLGTAAGGTSTQAKPLVIISQNTDYPRNLYYGVAGSSDMGGTWVVNGKNQFGETIQETVTIGTAANGGTVAGTKIFAQVSSGTFTVATAGVGNGSAKLGVAVGTSATTLYRLGLPVKIAAVADVKRITWTSQFLGTAVNGGTIGTAQIDTTNHAYLGQSIMAGTETFQFTIKPTFDNSGKVVMAGL